MKPVSLLPPGWDAKKAADRVLERLVNVCLPVVKGAHDSDFLVVSGKAYVVYMANEVQPGEAPHWPFVYDALSIVDVATGQVEKTITFAASEKAYDNETLPVGACFVPRLIRRDDRTLRCFFSSENPGTRQSQTWFIDFDVGRMDFVWELRKARIETDQTLLPMEPQALYRHAASRGFLGKPVDYGLYPIDGFKAFDGRVHAVLNNFPGAQNAWATLNDDMDRFTVLGHYFLPQDAKLTESAVNRLPDGRWVAISRRENGDKNYLFAFSTDGAQWTPHEAWGLVRNGTNSKPTFDCFGGIYYLGWQEATRIHGAFRSVFNIEVSRDGLAWERQYRFETDKSFQYPTFREGQGGIYLTVTQGDSSESRKERIMFGRLQ